MMEMNTQFGKMTITDDNKTIATDELQKHINDEREEDRKINFIKDTQKIDK